MRTLVTVTFENEDGIVRRLWVEPDAMHYDLSKGDRVRCQFKGKSEELVMRLEAGSDGLPELHVFSIAGVDYRVFIGDKEVGGHVD